MSGGERGVFYKSSYRDEQSCTISLYIMKYFFEYAATRPRNENNISASHYILYINILFSLKNSYNVEDVINDFRFRFR